MLDFFSFKNPYYCAFLIIGIILILIIKLFGSKIIGWFGELWTKSEIKKLPKDKYKVINDVFIYTNDSYHQIDHVVVSPYGIFSIETKQYNGYIVGDKYDKKWVRKVGKKTYYYTNPIRQNYGHVKSLSQLLNIDESKIFNVVCIPSRAKLNVKHDGEVVRYDEVLDKIYSYNEVIIDNVDELVEIIKLNNITDKKTKKEHIKNIRENIIDNDLSKCPKCGGQLVERTGKYGNFIGCSNYPRCKYTKNN